MLMSSMAPQKVLMRNGPAFSSLASLPMKKSGLSTSRSHLLLFFEPMAVPFSQSVTALPALSKVMVRRHHRPRGSFSVPSTVTR